MKYPKPETCPRGKREWLFLVFSETRRASFYGSPITCSGSPITREKGKRKDSAKPQEIEHTIEVYLNFSLVVVMLTWIKDKIWKERMALIRLRKKRRENIPRMINVRFWILALPFNPKVWRNTDRTYHADELYFLLPPFRRKTFSLLVLIWIIIFCFFYSIKEYC